MTAGLSTLRNFARQLLKKGSENLELRRRHRAIAAQATDYRRWTDSKSYNSNWSKRSDFALDLVGQAKWICDVGCGPQAMRKQLPADAVYLPMDLKQWTDDTIVCDINNKVLPADYLELCDVCFVMGVLEYIFDGSWFLSRLAATVEELVISYNVAELCKVVREDIGWVNNLTTQQYKDLIEAAGFKITDSQVFDNALIIKATNPAFDSAARRNRAAKREYFLKATRDSKATAH